MVVANAHLMDDTPLVDALYPYKAMTTFGSGLLTVTTPTKTALVLQPKERYLGGYSRYKRVK